MIIKKNISNRFSDSTMVYDDSTSVARNVSINGYILYSSTSLDGIALTPDLEYVYYCPLSSYRLYRVPTSILLTHTADTDNQIEYLGERISQMDGMTFSNESVLYFGSFHQDAVYHLYYNSSLLYSEIKNFSYFAANNEKLFVSDYTDIQWVDTFAWDEYGYLWFTTNRLHRYFLNNMCFNGSEGSNFRVNKVYVGSQSYMMYSYNNNNGQGGKSSNIVWIVIVVVIIVIVIIIILVGCRYYRKKQDARKDQTGLADFVAFNE